MEGCASLTFCEGAAETSRALMKKTAGISIKSGPKVARGRLPSLFTEAGSHLAVTFRDRAMTQKCKKTHFQMQTH